MVRKCSTLGWCRPCIWQQLGQPPAHDDAGTANFFLLVLSIFPFIHRWGYGSWYITRQIFPAKGVACGFIASGAWTVFMILEMYSKNNYAGQEALMVNCLTMGINLVTLFIYFLHGGENKKLWISLMVFLTMALAGLVWLVWHPNVIRSDTRKTNLKSHTQIFGIIGMVLFAIVNFFPFVDLWAMTFGGRNHFFTLLVPIMMNTGLSIAANCLWTMYAWLFTPRHPNYFMYANGMSTGMTIVQATWLFILRMKHTEVEGLITEVESLRSVLTNVSSSLNRLRAAPDRVWDKNSFLIRLQENLKTGGQSLMLMEISFHKLQSDLEDKTNAAAAAAAALAEANPGAIGNQGMAENAAAVNAALAQYPTLLEACRESAVGLENIEKSLRDKLYAQGRVEVEVEGLKIAVSNASVALDMFVASLRPCMQIINASQGIPPNLKSAFDYCREKMFIIKTAIDSEFCRIH